MLSFAESNKSDGCFGLICETTFKVSYVNLACFHWRQSSRSPWSAMLVHSLILARSVNSLHLAFFSALATDWVCGALFLGFLCLQLASSVAEHFAVLLEDAGVLAPLFDAISSLQIAS